MDIDLQLKEMPRTSGYVLMLLIGGDLRVVPTLFSYLKVDCY